MIIGIDISAIPYGTGVSNYTLNLLRHLLKIDHQNTYKLFFSSLRQPLPPEITPFLSSPQVKLYHFRLPPTLLEFLWHTLRFPSLNFFIGDCDIFHTWDWLQPPSTRTLMVTTIHDLVPLIYPQHQDPKTIAVFRRKINLAINSRTHFICVSQNTQRDFQKFYPQVPLSQISQVYEAADDKFLHYQKLSDELKASKIRQVYSLYDLKNYFLVQGTREPRKNLSHTIRAFNKFKMLHPTSKCILAISGKYGWGKDIDTPKKPWIKVLGYIPEKDIVSLHAAAICLINLSLYEGFGLQLIKSLAVGVPVIAADRSSFPEIVGQGGILVNPTSTRDIILALETIYYHPKQRQALSHSGLHQASKFSWKDTAIQTLAIYRHLYKNR